MKEEFQFKYETPNFIEGDLYKLASLLQLRHEVGDLPTNNSGTFYENEVFSIRAYCWCDGENPGHEKECPPNFLHKSSNFAVSWYKYLGRDTLQNQDLDVLNWHKVFEECWNSILAEKNKHEVRK